MTIRCPPAANFQKGRRFFSLLARPQPQRHVADRPQVAGGLPASLAHEDAPLGHAPDLLGAHPGPADHGRPPGKVAAIEQQHALFRGFVACRACLLRDRRRGVLRWRTRLGRAGSPRQPCHQQHGRPDSQVTSQEKVTLQPGHVAQRVPHHRTAPCKGKGPLRTAVSIPRKRRAGLYGTPGSASGVRPFKKTDRRPPPRQRHL